MDKIVISGIRAKGFHGVLPEERRVGQSFTVDCVQPLGMCVKPFHYLFDVNVHVHRLKTMHSAHH